MSSFLQMQCASTAMQVVVQEHAPAELRAQLEKQTQENERLRMQVEDLRQAQISHIPDICSRSRWLTWRELCQMEHQKIAYLNHEVIAPALDTFPLRFPNTR